MKKRIVLPIAGVIILVLILIVAVSGSFRGQQEDVESSVSVPESVVTDDTENGDEETTNDNNSETQSGTSGVVDAVEAEAVAVEESGLENSAGSSYSTAGIATGVIENNEESQYETGTDTGTGTSSSDEVGSTDSAIGNSNETQSEGSIVTELTEGDLIEDDEVTETVRSDNSSQSFECSSDSDTGSGNNNSLELPGIPIG